MSSYRVYPYNFQKKPEKTFLIENSIESLASFIAEASFEKSYIVTDAADNLIISTIGNFLDQCPDKRLLRELQPLLIKKQMSRVSEFQQEFE